MSREIDWEKLCIELKTKLETRERALGLREREIFLWSVLTISLSAATGRKEATCQQAPLTVFAACPGGYHKGLYKNHAQTACTLVSLSSILLVHCQMAHKNSFFFSCCQTNDKGLTPGALEDDTRGIKVDMLFIHQWPQRFDFQNITNNISQFHNFESYYMRIVFHLFFADIPKVMDVSMCLGEISYCLGKMFSKCSLHLVKNYNVMQKVIHSILHWPPISFLCRPVWKRTLKFGDPSVLVK